MDLKLTIVGNASVAQNKQERNPDNSVKTIKEKSCRIVARSETGDVLQFTTDYETGKGYELDKELTVSIQ